MNLFKRLFRKDAPSPKSGTDGFWEWFQKNQRTFNKAVRAGDNVDANFLDKLMPQLHAMNPKFYCSTGMYDEHTVELVITGEGDIKTFVFVEELVAAAPSIAGWKFTALNPPIPLQEISIDMGGYRFNDKKISFLYDEFAEYPDEIDVTLVHEDYNEVNKETITHGAFIYLDHVLGELQAATLIDSIQVTGTYETENRKRIGMEKLRDFLVWKEKEFVEKYEGLRYNTENDNYSELEGEDENGLPMLAVVNQELLDWDAKASHPWMMVFTIEYPGTDGLPDEKTYSAMNDFEDDLVLQLPDSSGYLNLGRKTYNGCRTIFFACKEFRRASKTAVGSIEKFRPDLKIVYDIYKDKYWMTMNSYKQPI